MSTLNQLDNTLDATKTNPYNTDEVKSMKEQFSIRVDSEDKKKIGIIAKRNKRTLNSQIEYIIANAIIDYEKVNGKIENEE